MKHEFPIKDWDCGRDRDSIMIRLFRYATPIDIQVSVYRRYDLPLCSD